MRILPKMKNTGAICNDLIRCYWIKRTYSTHKPLVHQFNTIYEQTACQNITHKLITENINSFMVDHCTVNNIITPEVGGGKQWSWGCTNQLLHKMVVDETKHHCCNLLMMWFYYKKGFDSASHNWILKAPELGHVPDEDN